MRLVLVPLLLLHLLLLQPLLLALLQMVLLLLCQHVPCLVCMEPCLEPCHQQLKQLQALGYLLQPRLHLQHLQPGQPWQLHQ